MLSTLLQGSRKSILFRAGLLIVVIAFFDARLAKELPLGFLYLLPMLMVGRVLNPWQIAVVAGLCTFLAEFFDAFVQGGVNVLLVDDLDGQMRRILSTR